MAAILPFRMAQTFITRRSRPSASVRVQKAAEL
jgi:hypothetical protein